MNKDAAQFTPSDLPPGTAAADHGRSAGTACSSNRTWQVDLRSHDDKGGTTIRGKIKNLTDRLQPFNANNELLFKCG